MVIFEVFWGFKREFEQDFGSRQVAGQQMHDLSCSYLPCQCFGVAVADSCLMNHEVP